MDLIKLTKVELLAKCQELGITRCSSKTKGQLIELIEAKTKVEEKKEIEVKDKVETKVEEKKEIEVKEKIDDEVETKVEEQGKGQGKGKGKGQGTDSPEGRASRHPEGGRLTVGLPFVDLFCGIGGFHQALKRVDGTCVFACDIDEKCRETYEKNYGLKPHADITKVNVAEIPDFDVLCAGFPCFVAGTSVLTNNSYKPIETVELTDKLLTHTGKFQPILNLQQKMYTGKLFELDIKYHPELIVATEEHPFYVRTRDGEPQWKIASELTMDDYFGMVINNNEIIPELSFEKTNHWFAFGYWVGNGFEIHNTLFDSIIKTEWYEIPEWFQDAPKELIQEFVNGYMKTDGLKKTASTAMIYGIQRLYLKLGKIISIVDGTIVNDSSSSFIEGNYVWYAPFKITTVETTNTPVYNFEVETDNSYVVENVCVHNCQAFSNSGKKKGFDDKRGRLYEYILDIAAHKQPRFLFLENVKHIRTIDEGKVFEEIMRRIGETGYTVHITELSPHQLGVPQQRERVIFTCIRNDIYDPAKSLDFPVPKVPINVGAIFETDPAKTAKYRISKDDEAILTAWDEMVKHMETGQNMSPTILCNEFGKTYSETEFAELAAWRREYITKNKPIYEKYKGVWDAWREKHAALLSKKEIYGKLEWQAGIKKENDSIFNYFIQLRQSGIRVKKTEYFPTLVAIVQTPIYAKEKRFITPRECARLQSFPDDFIMCENDHTAYKQFGNAVNVDVVHFVINNVLKLYGIV
jgi:DNA (cytosine-5)-methyltransferase 1